MDMTGVVLCGGAGTRMGRDKALIEIGGKPLIRLIAERLTECADPILLASGRRRRFGNLPYEEIADAAPGAGPISGLVAALSASPHDLLAVAAVDMPFVNAEVFRLLSDRHTDEDAVVPVTHEGRQPLHAVYHRSALPHLADALSRGRYGLREALAALDVREVGREEWGAIDADGRFALNLNTQEDLRSLT
ncbi:MAG: molybdenum cofactor guanylyltransferase [Actinomycetota bacterium]